MFVELAKLSVELFLFARQHFGWNDLHHNVLIAALPGAALDHALAPKPQLAPTLRPWRQSHRPTTFDSGNFDLRTEHCFSHRHR